MRGIEILVWLVIALLLRATPAVADVARDLARCALEAERLYPAPDNKGLANWPEREANLEKRADNTETCSGRPVTASWHTVLLSTWLTKSAISPTVGGVAGSVDKTRVPSSSRRKERRDGLAAALARRP
jgi:hypothetical protein